MSDLKEDLIYDEGFKNKIYFCSEGVRTIGYGFALSSLTPDEIALNGGRVEPMSEGAAKKILEVKVGKLWNKLFAALPWLENRPEHVKNALANMAYQLGLKGLLGFKNTLALVERGDYEAASANALKSHWAAQTPNRAARVTRLLSGGIHH